MKKLILVLLALCMTATAFATVSTNPGRNEYTAAAAQTIFNYTFKVYASTDLLVYQTPTGQDPDDTADLITGYTVAGVGVDAGGSITLNSGATSGDLITIVSAIPTNRTVDYQFNGDFLPDVVNNDFDRAVSMVKQLENTSVNTLKYQNSFQGGAGTLADPAAGNVIGYDGSGNLANLLLAVDGNSWDGLADLGDNTLGKGSDLVAHTSTAFTVTETLDGNITDIATNSAGIAANTADITALKVLGTVVDQRIGAAVSNDGSDAVNDLGIASGAWADATHKTVMVLDSALVKQADTVWAEGTNAGGLDTGTFAVDTWYYVWMIGTATGATTDALISASPTAPTMPSGYTFKRFLAPVYAYDNAATPTWRQFIQEGNHIQWATPINDVALASAPTTPTTTPVSTPAGLTVDADLTVYWAISAGSSNERYGLITSTDSAVKTASSTAFNIAAREAVSGLSSSATANLLIRAINGEISEEYNTTTSGATRSIVTHGFYNWRAD